MSKIDAISGFSGPVYNQDGKGGKKVADSKTGTLDSCQGGNGGSRLFEMTYANAVSFAENRYSFLQKTVELMIAKQAQKSRAAAAAVGTDRLAAQKASQEKILEEAMMKDPQWGAEAVAGRILSHARKLAEHDRAKAELLLDAFKTGYKAAEAAWGGELPDVCRKTYHLVVEGFQEWAGKG